MSRTAFVVAITGFVPLALTFTACERTITNEIHEEADASTCFTCHSDQNTFLVAAELQWQNSTHASGRRIEENSATCSGCHTSEGFITRITGGTPVTVEIPTVIHCFTCHAPHTNSDFRLRVTAPQALLNGASEDINAGNLCVSCHRSRRNVDTYVTQPTNLTTRFGPHNNPQGDMLFGSNGYEYAGFTYRDFSAHRTFISPDTNVTKMWGLQNDGCLECHFKHTQNNVIGGHSFVMEADHNGEELFNVEGCNACHSGANLDESFDYMGRQTAIISLTDSLRTILQTANLVGTDGLPRSVTGVRQDTTGAVWNYMMSEAEQSHGVHNPWYIEDLLVSSIMYMQGQLPQPSPNQPVPVAIRKPATDNFKER
jgi:hypothetical protein